MRELLDKCRVAKAQLPRPQRAAAWGQPRVAMRAPEMQCAVRDALTPNFPLQSWCRGTAAAELASLDDRRNPTQVNEINTFSELPLTTLVERSTQKPLPLPTQLVALYGGPLAMSEQILYANFVSSVDGVVALRTAGDSGPVISQHSAADRFVMGVLRACADAIIVGAGTFRNAVGHRWHADVIYPPGAEMFTEARQALGLGLHPRLVLVTRSGEIDVDQPAVPDALIVTSAAGARELRQRRANLNYLVLPDEMPMAELIEQLHQQGLRRLLTEGGPSLFAQLVAGGLLDELFLTSSPTLFGRFPSDHRKSVTDGIDLAGSAFDLLSLRIHGSHLFLRYALKRS